ncbi:MAG TPA: energy transducer TonB [Terracidiphilus sp.]|jgi:TonB family protein|nr:energy transducer TonB [Terracidiphilus sp.]
MRTLLVASLLATTALLNAQTSPHGQVANLEARTSAPAAVASDIPASSTARRVTTGVTAPELISQRPIKVATYEFPNTDLAAQKVVVHFTVDAFGVPQNVKLVKSVSPAIDARVIAAVGGFRYKPAQLDSWNVPADVNLVVNFTK